MRTSDEGLGTRAQIGIGDLTHVDAAVAAAAMGPLPADALARLEPLYERDFA